MRATRSRSRAFRFETLENRAMLAGNVLASVSGTTLNITGDAAANSIQITQNSSGNWKVTGVATKVNGSSSFTSNTLVTDILIDLMAGNDTTNISKGSLSGEILWSDASGNDT